MHGGSLKTMQHEAVSGIEHTSNEVLLKDEITIWDPLVRLFHWSLVAAFFTAFTTGNVWEEVHIVAGYTIAGLVLFRLLWGFIGPRHARFRDFIRAPATVLRYIRELGTKRPVRYLGHNPPGGWMVVMLLLSLVLTAFSGMMAYGTFSGTMKQLGTAIAGDAFEIIPVYEFFESLHAVLAPMTLALVALHVSGVVVTSLLYRENLVRAMLTGRKRRHL